MNTIAPPVAVGIDVAKATLCICIRDQEMHERILSIRNTDTDLTQKVMPYLQNYTGRIVMESTGHYHWTPALNLREAGMNVYVVNPLLAKQYTAGTIRKVKTDPADAKGLARMATVCDNLPAPFVVSKHTLYIRKKLATIGTMAHQTQALEASLRSLREGQQLLGYADTSVVLTLAESITQLKRALHQLEQECITLTQSDIETTSMMERLVSIPGVSSFCATMALNWLSPDTATSAKSFIGFCGLDVSSRESGTWKGRCRLTKRGNPFLRKRLYSAAWGAAMNYPSYRLYYDTLKQNGRGHKEALIIIARKLVRVMYTVMTQKVMYDKTRDTFPMST